jgi:hypothetical protein
MVVTKMAIAVPCPDSRGALSRKKKIVSVEEWPMIATPCKHNAIG